MSARRHRALAPLDRKLMRDLQRMKGQAAAIAAVIALGALTLVMMDRLVNSLDETKRAYYERYRLADVFAPLKRAPSRPLERLERIPGVSRAGGRISGAARLTVSGIAGPSAPGPYPCPTGRRRLSTM